MAEGGTSLKMRYFNPLVDMPMERDALEYLRDVVVENTDLTGLEMDDWNCCLAAKAITDDRFKQFPNGHEFAHSLGLTSTQRRHIFSAHGFGGNDCPSRSELKQHVQDVLDGRVV